MEPLVEAGTLIASRYRVVREIGRGGMGVVYLVEHVHTGDQLALKLLLGSAAINQEAVTRFQREARASARIKSEHIVKVVDADVAADLDNAPFLVMELLEGSDLEKLVEQRGRIPFPEAMGYLAQTARALDKAHAAGIVHRDLKPENIFIHRPEGAPPTVKVVDFGISKFLDKESNNQLAGAKMTSTGAVMGTPLFMSPEQALGRVGEIGPPTDVWAMGLVTMFVLTGEVYWKAETLAELMGLIVYAPMQPPTGRWPFLPPGIDAWFAKSCAREPAQRFAHPGEQMDALGEVLGVGRDAQAFLGSSQPSLPDVSLAASGSSPAVPWSKTTHRPLVTDPPEPPKRSRVPIFGIAGVGVVLAVAAIWATSHLGGASANDAKTASAASQSVVSPVASAAQAPVAASATTPPPPVEAPVAAVASAPSAQPSATDPAAANAPPQPATVKAGSSGAHPGSSKAVATPAHPHDTTPTKPTTAAPAAGQPRFDPASL